MPAYFLALPNEILVNILLPLNGPDLQASCLISSGLNDVASSVLYRNLVWKANPEDKWPASAFHRRPWLRNAVRQLFINDSLWTSNQMKKASKHLLKFPLLTKIAWIRNNLHNHDFDVYIEAVTQIRTLEELQFPSFFPRSPTRNSGRYEFSKLVNIRSLIFVEEPKKLAFEWLELVKPNLVSLFIDHTISMDYLSGCRSLQRLTLGTTYHFKNFITILANLNQLRDLTLSFAYWSLSSWDAEAAGLRYLRTLRLQCRDPAVNMEAQKRICRLYRCLASDSKCLVDLHFELTFFDHKYYFVLDGDVFVDSILRHHRTSLRSFTLSSFYLTASALTRLVHKCPQLDALEFLSQNVHLDDIGPILGNFQQLRLLRISIPDLRGKTSSILFLQQSVSNLLQQTLRTVCQFYIRIIERNKLLFCLWEAQWLYDNDLQCPRRQVRYVPDYNEDQKRAIRRAIESSP